MDNLALAYRVKELEKELAKYKSLVKTIDPDNFPIEEVLAYCYDGTFEAGALYKNKDKNRICVDIGIYGSPICTHYIEQKDLIGLLSK